MEPNEQTLNLNNAHCVQETWNWGETIYHNICNGTQAAVPWGVLGHMTTWGLLVLLGVIILLFLAMGLTILKDVFGW